jgi:hypothetical protein
MFFFLEFEVDEGERKFKELLQLLLLRIAVRNVGIGE